MKNLFVLGVALCVGGISGTGFAGPCYDIEALIGADCSFEPEHVFPEDIASDGTIIGDTVRCDGTSIVFVWPLVDEPYLVHPPDPATVISATSVNGNGQMGVVLYFPGNGIGEVGAVYDLRTGSYIPVGIPPGGTFSKPIGINNRGSVAGEWGNTLIGPPQKALVNAGGVLIDLGAFLPWPKSRANDINDDNLVVGYGFSGSVSSPHYSFVWRNGTLTELGFPPGCNSSSAAAVNGHDEVAVNGAESVPGGIVGHAYIWKAEAWIELAPIPGYEDISGQDISDHRVVVGGAYNPEPLRPEETGFVWIEGVTYDLSQRIVTDLTVELGTALGVNNAGQIACQGRLWVDELDTWIRVAFRLTPRPPQPADFTDDCTVDGADLVILLQSWGKLGRRNANRAADLDGSGVVNGFDLAILLAAWG